MVMRRLGNSKLAVLNRAAHPILAFLHRRFRQANDE
jgi:hypothetical protein